MRLSICIPTHHGRVKYLKEAIDSVVDQLTPDLQNQIEICVSDDASEDGTCELIEQYQKEHPNLFVYSRNEKNQGLAINVLKVVALAHGDFCWFLSSDDQIEKGGIGQVIELLDRYPDTAGLAVHLGLYDLHMEKEIAQMPLVWQPGDLENLRVFSSTDEALDESLFVNGQMSQLVFDRKLWGEVVRTEGLERLMKFNYVDYIYIIGKILTKHPKWLFYPVKLIKARQQNASLVALHRDSELEYHQEMFRALSETQAALRGRSHPSYKIWMRKAYIGFSWYCPPYVIEIQRLELHHQYKDDFALSLGYARYWYFIPQFWYRTFPAFLLPLIFVKTEIGIRNWLKMRTRLRGLRERVSKAVQELKHSRSVQITTLDDHKMLLHPLKVDNVVSRTLVQDKIWEPFETKLFKEIVGSGMTVADLGANIGYYALLAAKCVGPNGRVYAFEPAPDNYRLLVENIRLNQYGSYVIPVKKAVGASSGEVELFLSPDNRGDHRTYHGNIFSHDSSRQHIRVPSISLDDFFSDEAIRLDVIKMDIQGYEFSALKGMQRVLARCRKLFLLTEVWPKGLSEAGSSTAEYVQSLLDNEFDLFLLDDSSSAMKPVNMTEVLKLAADRADSMYLNLLCRKG